MLSHLNGSVDVLAVDADGDTHDHVLGALGNLAVDLEEVGFLQGLEAKVIVLEVAVMDDGGVEAVLVGHDDLVVPIRNERSLLSSLGVHVVVENFNVVREPLMGHLVQVGHRNTSGENREVRVLGGIVGSSLGGKLIKLSSCHTRVNALDNLLRDANRVDKLGGRGGGGEGYG